jgi:hypothetical protein
MDVVNVENVLDNKQILIVILVWKFYSFKSFWFVFVGHMKKHIINLSRNGE